jgi:hypothetical protein
MSDLVHRTRDKHSLEGARMERLRKYNEPRSAGVSGSWLHEGLLQTRRNQVGEKRRKDVVTVMQNVPEL